MKAPSFSIILPTYNRVHCICNAIDSVLKQTYQKFELIIIDDGSTDGTDKTLSQRYAEQLKSGKIIYKRIQKSGVCKARNEGLRLAKNDWIAYVDSDNTVMPYFLGVFAHQIIKNPEVKNFYAQYQPIGTNNIDWTGHSYSLLKLYNKNFIDLGTYVHAKDLIDELGSFDENMKRLVDWDLILMQCKHYAPHYIPINVLNYSNGNDKSRITNSILNVQSIIDYVHRKHKDCIDKRIKVTTIILAYNHQKTIKCCIDSALSQVGQFDHKIIIIDDCSTDSTYGIVSKYSNCKNVTLHKMQKNVGQALALKKALSLTDSKYVAVLEGDDKWLSNSNLQKKICFLEDKNNKDCSMVFSKIEIHNDKFENIAFYSPVQCRINKFKLTENDVLSINGWNPLCNYSCCLFKTGILKTIGIDVFAVGIRFISEIAIEFLCLKFGKIGFIDEALTYYRISKNGSYSNADAVKRLEFQLNARNQALQLCSENARPRIQEMCKYIKNELEKFKTCISMHSKK